MCPNIDFFPNNYITSLNESFLNSQTLVVQITNPGAQSLTLQNVSGGQSFAFKPIEKATPIDGLTMFYLVFPLGDCENDFTTEEFFDQITIVPSDNLCYQRVGKDTIVIFPKRNISLEQLDLLEVLLCNVVSTGKAENMICVDITYFDSNTKIPLGRRALYRKAPPMTISAFSLDRACETFAFRDKLTFSYAVLEATQSMLIPGDIALSEQTSADKDLHSIETVIYRPTVYGINAFNNENMVSRTLACNPQKASIRSFKGSYTTTDDQTREVILEIEVENTRHVYLNKLGRIEVIPNQKNIKKLENQSPKASYKLYVENEDGLIMREIEWK